MLVARESQGGGAGSACAASSRSRVRARASGSTLMAPLARDRSINPLRPYDFVELAVTIYPAGYTTLPRWEARGPLIAGGTFGPLECMVAADSECGVQADSDGCRVAADSDCGVRADSNGCRVAADSDCSYSNCEAHSSCELSSEVCWQGSSACAGTTDCGATLCSRGSE